MYESFARPFRAMGKSMMQISSIYFILCSAMPYPNGEIIL
jgi:hypothetical protein